MSGRKIRLHVDTDEICSACPNNCGGHCKPGGKVVEYDQAVLDRCGFEAGQVLEFKEFTHQVQKKILATDGRKEICGNCQWNSICEEQKSRLGIEKLLRVCKNALPKQLKKKKFRFFLKFLIFSIDKVQKL